MGGADYKLRTAIPPDVVGSRRRVCETFVEPQNLRKCKGFLIKTNKLILTCLRSLTKVSSERKLSRKSLGVVNENQGFKSKILGSPMTIEGFSNEN